MKKFRIISFDGGGLKGLVSLGILERISSELGSDEWIQMADMFAGTSTGGLIALALADGMSVSDIKDFYTKSGPHIFNKRTALYASSLWRFLHVGYDNRVLSDDLSTMFKERTLTQLKKNVVVVSYDLSRREGKRDYWAPKIFQNFAGDGQDDNSVARVGLYTSAAPTYLPSVDGFVDGGVCANNPSMCALSQVLDGRNDTPRELAEICLISIGTGVNPVSVRKKFIWWGILRWNVKLLRIIMDGATGIADYQCRQILTTARYLRMQKELDEKFEMDDASRIDQMTYAGLHPNEERLSGWVNWINDRW